MKDKMILYKSDKFWLMRNVPDKNTYVHSFRNGNEDYNRALQACADSALEIINPKLLRVYTDQDGSYLMTSKWEIEIEIKDGDTFELPIGFSYDIMYRHFSGTLYFTPSDENETKVIVLKRLTEESPSEPYPVTQWDKNKGPTFKEAITFLQDRIKGTFKAIENGGAQHYPFDEHSVESLTGMKRAYSDVLTEFIRPVELSEPSAKEETHVTFVTPDLMYWKSCAKELIKERDALNEENAKLLLLRTEAYHEKAGLESELTRAKELLKKIRNITNGIESLKIWDEIESFLKEVKP